MSDADLDRRTRLAGWRVADLVAHAEQVAGDPPAFLVRLPAARAAEAGPRVSCVLGCLHALDLAAAVGMPAPVTDDALAVAVETTATALAAAAPGRSVELRIPGPAGVAVQCVAGPAHTRGTPPNVVETSPTTWLELAAGRLTWAEAVATARVGASGRRADLSGHLPVMRCPGEPTRLPAGSAGGP